jgi:hypothetical protein
MALRMTKTAQQLVIILATCVVIAAQAFALQQTDTERLAWLFQQILEPRQASTALQQEVVELTQILHRNGTVRFDFSDNPAEGETRTGDGLALSPAMAAQCAADSARTVVFMRGLHAAIVAAAKQSRGRPVRVLYVGSGPYALLATPQMTVFSPEEAQFKVLDIHEPSVKSAKSVIDALGLSASVTAYDVVDAHDYQISPEHSPDVIVMEIMTAALENEPQVAITRHLMEQAPAAILVPESITIDAYLVDAAKEFAAPSKQSAPRSQDRVHLGVVFELSAASVANWKDAGDQRLPAASIQMPEAIAPGYVPMLFTTIRTYNTNTLNEYESGLTMPRAFSGSAGMDSGDTVNLYYQLGKHPGLLAESPL